MKKTFLLALLAGLAIGIGGVIFLTLENKIIGSLLFTVGLYTICSQGLNLYTGKVGYLVDNDLSYLKTLAIIWIGNLVGTGLSALCVLYTRIQGIQQTAYTITQVKVNDNYISLFLLAIFCGMLMFIAVDGYKKTNNPVILFVCVSVFILCGFEHCIADMFYFWLANCWSIDLVLKLLIITLGNSLGGILIPYIKKI